MERIFLDMDGVIADFSKAALESFGCLHLIDQFTFGVEADTLLGLTRSEFWRILYEHHPDFWHHVPPYSWTSYLYEELCKIAPVTIISKPDLNPASLDGKLNWLQRQLKISPFEDYIFTRKKHLVARPGYVLIDDNIDTAKLWKENDGTALIFPQPWNSPTLGLYDPQKAVAVVSEVAQLFEASKKADIGAV